MEISEPQISQNRWRVSRSQASSSWAPIYKNSYKMQRIYDWLWWRLHSFISWELSPDQIDNSLKYNILRPFQASVEQPYIYIYINIYLFNNLFFYFCKHSSRHATCLSLSVCVTPSHTYHAEPYLYLHLVFTFNKSSPPYIKWN